MQGTGTGQKFLCNNLAGAMVSSERALVMTAWCILQAMACSGSVVPEEISAWTQGRTESNERQKLVHFPNVWRLHDTTPAVKPTRYRPPRSTSRRSCTEIETEMSPSTPLLTHLSNHNLNSTWYFCMDVATGLEVSMRAGAVGGGMNRHTAGAQWHGQRKHGRGRQGQASLSGACLHPSRSWPPAF